MVANLQEIHSSAPSGEIFELLERDGAVIIQEAIPESLLGAINLDLDGLVEKTAPGLRHATHDEAVEFYGNSTIRFDGLPGRSLSFLDIMRLPFLIGTADHFLLSNCEDYLLNTGQLIQIGPGQKSQPLHRDDDSWDYIEPPRKLVQIEAMFALSDFTAENGATQVVPGSHNWTLERKPTLPEITRAEMKAGSALLYLGSTLHGGGANLTDDEWRRGMFLGYVVGWLRTEENMFLTVPIDKVHGMPTRIQELLGYKPHAYIGVVDVGSPMKLLT
ncbi:MAG: ectoine hydroxylase-related dioxygenase (phytanoyl-CoA dioxygenase family) [Gammaproteobacteria bacterium]|jgi:ectoine hydroxylase-related dioxygenase (phytanoyl-CoA dioxygenase family)